MLPLPLLSLTFVVVVVVVDVVVDVDALATVAHAQPAPTVAEHLSRARDAERAHDYDAAEAAYEAAVAVGGSTRLGRRAATRLEWLEARRDDALGYAPLAALERARTSDLDAGKLARFEAEARAMPPGRVRREALFLVAEGWFRRRGDPARAIPVYEMLRDEPGVTAHERSIATVGIAEARAALGDIAGGVDALERVGLGASFEATALRTAELRRSLRIYSFALLAFSIVALLALGRPWRAGREGARRVLGLGRALAVLYVLAVPAAIAALYADGVADVFGLFALGALPILAVAALSGESLARRSAARSAHGIVVVALVVSTVALAYLALDASGGLDPR